MQKQMKLITTGKILGLFLVANYIFDILSKIGASLMSAVISQQLISLKNGELVPVFEVMTNSQAVRNQIREGKTHQLKNSIAASLSEGMVSMDQTLLEYVKKGLITEDEALLHSFEPEVLMKKFQSNKA